MLHRALPDWPACLEAGGFRYLRGYFHNIKQLESAIAGIYEMQANKIKQYKGLKFPQLLEAMEENDKPALYEVQKYLYSSPLVRSFFDYQLIADCAQILGADPNLCLLEGPALFVSRPNTSRLLYKWHSEAHYYPKRRKFLNLWFPIFTDRTKENGAMQIKPGTQDEQWDFAEYNSGPNTFVQYEIPEEHVAEYPSYICEGKRGDLLIFDRNLVHRSSNNASNEYAFACVARVWYPGDDLTLSGNMAATPYGNDIGRADLDVAR